MNKHTSTYTISFFKNSFLITGFLQGNLVLASFKNLIQCTIYNFKVKFLYIIHIHIKKIPNYFPAILDKNLYYVKNVYTYL